MPQVVQASLLSGLLPAESAERVRPPELRAAGNAATAYLAVGDTARVEQYANLALDTFDAEGFTGPEAMTRVDFATALLDPASGDVERAASLVADAYRIGGAASFPVRLRVTEFVDAAVAPSEPGRGPATGPQPWPHDTAQTLNRRPCCSPRRWLYAHRHTTRPCTGLEDRRVAIAQCKRDDVVTGPNAHSDAVIRAAVIRAGACGSTEGQGRSPVRGMPGR